MTRIETRREFVIVLKALVIFVTCLFVGGTPQYAHAMQEIRFEELKPEKSVAELTLDWNTWYQFAYYRTRLSEEFIGLDADAKPMEKMAFLKQLASGGFIALRLLDPSSRTIYRLAEYRDGIKSITRTTQQFAQKEIQNTEMEGKIFPHHRFVDLEGKAFDSQHPEKKVRLYKTWFIRCQACIEEFPKLNQLVQDMKHRRDLEFISLALDEAVDLRKFLEEKPFSYAVIPLMRNFIFGELKTNNFPTHILVSKSGQIRKVSTDIDDVLPALKRELDMPEHSDKN